MVLRVLPKDLVVEPEPDVFIELLAQLQLAELDLMLVDGRESTGYLLSDLKLA